MAETGAKQKALFPLPAVIDPPNTVCVQIEIPDDPGYIRAFWGNLLTLTKWSNWQRDDNKQGALAARRCWDMWHDALELFYSGNPCPGEGTIAVPEFQFTQDCLLQYRFDSGDDWTTVPGWADYAADCFTGPAGPPGADGADGTCPDDCKDGPFNPPDNPRFPEADPGEDVSCVVATSAVAALKAGLQASIDAKSEATFLGFIQFLISFLLQLLYNPFGAAEQIWDAINQTAVAELETLRDDAAFWDSVTCYLYCEISTGTTLTNIEEDAFAAHVTGTGTANAEVIATLIGLLGMEGIRRLSLEYSTKGTNPTCSACVCGNWCNRTTFGTADDGAGQWSNWGSPTYTLQVNSIAGATFNQYYYLGIGVSFAQMATFTQMEIQYSLYSSADTAAGVYLRTGGVTGTTVWTGNLPVGIDRTETFTIPDVAADAIVIDMRNLTNAGVACAINWIEFNGDGVNPFSAGENCP